MTGPLGERAIAYWGIAAIACGALAILSANIAGFIPAQVLNGLHTTRIQGASINQMRTQLAELRQENIRLSSENRTLVARFNLMDDGSGEMARRLAAVEKSLPLLIESLPLSSDIDRSLLTASIVASAGEVYEIEGGTMVVRQMPLFGGIAPQEAAIASQPLPPPLPERQALPVLEPAASGEAGAVGIAVGDGISREAAPEAYLEILAKAGPLLLGVQPLLARSAETGEARIVLGPLPDRATAQSLCARLVRLDLACDPASYEGLAL